MTIEVQRKYLELNSLENLFPAKPPTLSCKLELLKKPNFQLNKFFYKQIGKNFRWIDRLSWSDNKWNEYVNNSKVKTFILKDKNELVGYVEQIFHYETFSCELAYLGILEEFYGKKYGGYLLTEAIKNSFVKNIERIWVHTCSLDHKNALNNYLARGMKVYKSEKIYLNID